MPATERSLGLKDGVVERSVIGDEAVKGRSKEHLVLPLIALNVHIERWRRWLMLSHSRVRAWWVQGGCIQGVHAGWVHAGVYT